MTTSSVARVSAGIPTGGQFAATTHPEPSLTLRAPAVDEAFVAATLEAAGDTRTTSTDLLHAITGRLNESRNFSDENVVATRDAVWRENYGYTPYEQDSFETAINGLRENAPTPPPRRSATRTLLPATRSPTAPSMCRPARQQNDCALPVSHRQRLGGGRAQQDTGASHRRRRRPGLGMAGPRWRGGAACLRSQVAPAGAYRAPPALPPPLTSR